MWYLLLSTQYNLTGKKKNTEVLLRLWRIVLDNSSKVKSDSLLGLSHWSVILLFVAKDTLLSCTPKKGEKGSPSELLILV